MTKQERKKAIIFFTAVALVFMIGSILTGGSGHEETVQEMMKDAVMHDINKVSLLGLKDVNPALIAGFIVSGIMITFALICRIFVIPRFKLVPGKFQMILEMVVGIFSGMAKTNSKHLNGFLGAYIFAAGSYIFTGTLFELLGVQVMTTSGHPITLPAPLADVNGAIMMGCLSYLVIMSGGIAGNGVKGIGKTLKDFSLPISLSFRLFGALLSGALVTELVYYYTAVSYVVPVIIGVLFTLLHALIQAYVLTMLTSVFYGEVSEKVEKKPKVKKQRGKKRVTVVNQNTTS